MKSFNVIIWEPNSKKFVPYDIIPYLVNAYKETIERHKEYPNNDYWKVPKTFEEFKRYIQKEAQYQFWSRCEYEIILVDWPNQTTEKKIDIHWQIIMNLDQIAKIVMDICRNENI